MDGYEGHIYGTVSPAHPKSFDTIEQAKAYVEEQSLVGLTVNKLHVDV
jgi:viroplasmin and RNaseH domain-containing protein